MFQSVLNALLQKYVSPYVKNVKKVHRSNAEPCGLMVKLFKGVLEATWCSDIDAVVDDARTWHEILVVRCSQSSLHMIVR